MGKKPTSMTAKTMLTRLIYRLIFLWGICLAALFPAVQIAFASEEDTLYTIQIGSFSSYSTAIDICNNLQKDYDTEYLPALRIESRYPYKIVFIGLFSQQETGNLFLEKFIRRYPKSELKPTEFRKWKILKSFQNDIPDDAMAGTSGEASGETPGEAPAVMPGETPIGITGDTVVAEKEREPAIKRLITRDESVTKMKLPESENEPIIPEKSEEDHYTWELRPEENLDYIGNTRKKITIPSPPDDIEKGNDHHSEVVENMVQSYVHDDNGNHFDFYKPNEGHENENPKRATALNPISHISSFPRQKTRNKALDNRKPFPVNPQKVSNNTRDLVTEDRNKRMSVEDEAGSELEFPNLNKNLKQSIDTELIEKKSPISLSNNPEIAESSIRIQKNKHASRDKKNNGFLDVLKPWTRLLIGLILTSFIIIYLLIPNNQKKMVNKIGNKQNKVEALFEKIDTRGSYGRPRLSEFVEDRMMKNIRELEQIEANILTESRDLKSLLVTSCFAGEGKTITSLSIAYALSMGGGHRVLLIDANLENPNIHRFFNINNTLGFVDFLTAGSVKSDAIIATAYRNLYIMPYGGLYAENINPFRLKTIHKRMESLKRVFDFVILDGCSMLGSSETSHILNLINGVIMVVECEKTKWEVVKIAQEKIHKAGGKILGAVLNKRRYYIPKILYKKL